MPTLERRRLAPQAFTLIGCRSCACLFRQTDRLGALTYRLPVRLDKAVHVSIWSHVEGGQRTLELGEILSRRKSVFQADSVGGFRCEPEG